MRFALTRRAALPALVLYSLVLALITVVPLRITTDRTTQIKRVPLGSVLDCVTGTDGPPEAPQFCVENVVGNVLLFVPFGALLPLAARRFRSAAAITLLALVISTSIEAIQYAERRIGVGRTVDIDDVLWNVAGAYIGYRIAARLTRPGWN